MTVRDEVREDDSGHFEERKRNILNKIRKDENVVRERERGMMHGRLCGLILSDGHG